jgi:hypothetical protein
VATRTGLRKCSLAPPNEADQSKSSSYFILHSRSAENPDYCLVFAPNTGRNHPNPLTQQARSSCCCANSHVKNHRPDQLGSRTALVAPWVRLVGD